MPEQPNILFLMTDQMQGRVLEAEHPCRMPNFDRLAARGVRFRRAYTTNAVCSPARASLMTGALPHKHGVLEVIHSVDDDQSALREQLPHWAQRLQDAGYRTGYFGKWHVERSGELSRFGWETHETEKQISARRGEQKSSPSAPTYLLDTPPGYGARRFHGATDTPAEERFVGLTAQAASDFLRETLPHEQPWCCFVSVIEPHDPFIAGWETLETYDIDSIPLPHNADDEMTDKPGLYRKAARVFAGLSERQQREAAACYYASITEIDEQFGRLLDQIEAAGQTENTIVVLTSDHGELLGAHGLYCKNVGAFEEVYNIPLVIAGPGIARGELSEARVGLHEIGPTLLELAGAAPLETTDSRSFAPILSDVSHEANFQIGYAEYYGTRYRLTQKILWDGAWKLVHNGFDEDELYNLDDDLHEMTNLIDKPEHEERKRVLFARLWEKIRQSGDHTILNTGYPPLRLAPYGPQNT